MSLSRPSLAFSPSGRFFFSADRWCTEQALEQAGVNVKFLARTLRCEGGVTVRMEGTRLELEGPLCDAYFRVRQVVYQQYTIV